MDSQFKMSLEKTPLRTYGYHVATTEDLVELNKWQIARNNLNEFNDVD